MLTPCLDEIVPALTVIINKSLQTGCVPASFKTALVTPLLKKPNLDKNDLKNYRPVSNLPFLSKITEKVVLKQLLQHLQNNHLLEPFQSAYRTGHNTETALLSVMNGLLLETDKGNVVLLNMLDLSAAFDAIDQPFLSKD